MFETKWKEFQKAISFRDSAVVKFQANKRSDWFKAIAPVGFLYYDWGEGFACYDKLKDTIELCETHSYRQMLLSYASFVDLNGDNSYDIIFSNIYDQFIKTQSNWTDIYFNLNGKYKSIMLRGYLTFWSKVSNNLILIKTIEQPSSKGKNNTLFKLHLFELDITDMKIKEISVQDISKKYVKQSE